MKVNDLLKKISKKGSSLILEDVLHILPKLADINQPLKELTYWEGDRSTKNLLTNTETFAMFTYCLPPNSCFENVDYKNGQLLFYVITGNIHIQEAFGKVFNSFNKTERSLMTTLHETENYCINQENGVLKIQNPFTEKAIVLGIKIKERELVLQEVSNLKHNYDAINGICITN